MQAERHGRVGRGELPKDKTQPICREHYVDRQIDLGFEAFQQPLHLRAQLVDALSDAAGLRQHGAAVR